MNKNKKTDKKKLNKSLEKSSKSFLEKLKTVVLGKSKVDAAVLDDLEEIFKPKCHQKN